MNYGLGQPADARPMGAAAQEKAYADADPQCNQKGLARIVVDVILGLIIGFTDLLGRFITCITDCLLSVPEGLGAVFQAAFRF